MKTLEESITSLGTNIDKEDESITGRTERRKENLPGFKKTGKLYPGLGSDQVPKDLEGVQTDGWNKSLPDLKKTEKLIQKAVCRQRLEQGSSGCKRKRSQEEKIEHKRKTTRRQRLQQGSSGPRNDQVTKTIEGVRGRGDENLGVNIAKENENISFKKVGKLILKAFRSQGLEQGSSLNSIKCYLASKCHVDVNAADSLIRKNLRVALYRGILSEIDGKYTIKERRKRGAERKCPGLRSDQVPKDLKGVRTDGWNENLPCVKKAEKLIQKAVCRQRLEQGYSGCKRKRSQEEKIERKREITRRQRFQQGSSGPGNDQVTKDLEGVRGRGDENLGVNIAKENEKISFKKIGKLILKAFRSQGLEQGSSLNSIKCYLASKCHVDVNAADSFIRKNLRVALYRGILSEIDGKYAIKERRKRGAERESPRLGSDQVLKDLEGVRTDKRTYNLPGFKKNVKFIQEAVCRQILEQGSSGLKRKRSEEETIDLKRKAIRRQTLQERSSGTRNDKVPKGLEGVRERVDETMGLNIAKENDDMSFKDIGKLIRRAVRSQGLGQGSSLTSIKCYLASKCHLDVNASDSLIRKSLRVALFKGILSEIDGKYITKERRRRWAERKCPGTESGKVPKDLEGVRTDRLKENLPGLKRTENLIQKTVCRQRLEQGFSGRKRKRWQEETIDRKRKGTRRQRLQQGSSGPRNDQVPKDPEGVRGPLDKNLGLNIAKENGNMSFKEIGKLILKAFRSQRLEQGSSMNSIKCYLASKCHLDVNAAYSRIRKSLRVALCRGIISEIDGKYTIKKGRRRGARRESPGLGSDQVLKDLEGVRTDRRKDNLPGFKKNGKFILEDIHRQSLGQASSIPGNDQVPKDLKGVRERVDETLGVSIAKENEDISFKDIGKLIRRAVRSQGLEQGSSLTNIKCYLASKCDLDVNSADSLIRKSLRVALFKGILSEIDGKYITKERQRRWADGKCPCLGSDQVSKDLEGVRTDGWKEKFPGLKKTENSEISLLSKTGARICWSQEETINRKRKGWKEELKSRLDEH